MSCVIARSEANLSSRNSPLPLVLLTDGLLTPDNRLRFLYERDALSE